MSNERDIVLIHHKNDIHVVDRMLWQDAVDYEYPSNHYMVIGWAFDPSDSTWFDPKNELWIFPEDVEGMSLVPKRFLTPEAQVKRLLLL